jgi:hypothetical protein
LPAFKIQPQFYEDHRWLAEQSAHAISSSRPRVSNFFSALRVLAAKKGYRDASHESKTMLASVIQERFSQDFLDWLGVKAFHHNKPADWLKWFLLRNPAQEKSRNTLPYILLAGSLFSSLKEFEHEALILMEKETVYFANQDEAIRTGIDEGEVNQHRNIFSAFIEKHPEANQEMVVSAIKRSHNFLVRNDPDWPPLKRIKKESGSKNKSRIIRFSRSELDIEKAAELEKFFDDMYAKLGMPIRVTKLMAIRSVGLRHHYNNDSELLVSVNEVLNRRVESDDAFCKRKILWAISELIQTEATFTITAVITKSGISTHHRPIYESFIHDQLKASQVSKFETKSKPVPAQLQLF